MRPRDLADKMSTVPVSTKYTLPIAEARTKAREIINQASTNGIIPVIENWHFVSMDHIEFTVRHLPNSDWCFLPRLSLPFHGSPGSLVRGGLSVAPMRKLIWLATFSVISIGGLFAARNSVATDRVVPNDLLAADLVDLGNPALAKSDRLPSHFFDSAPPIAAVATAEVVPPDSSKRLEIPPRQTESSKDDIVSWHWHEGTRVIRRRRSQ
jgi:hypothetical protein